MSGRADLRAIQKADQSIKRRSLRTLLSATFVMTAITVIAACGSDTPKSESTVLAEAQQQRSTEPSTTAAPVAAWPLLAKGAESQQVLVMQYLLRAQGVTVSADGGFGPKTEAALIKFQTSKQLTASGTADAATWTALATSVDETSSPNVVKALQVALRVKNPQLKLTGKFDEPTQTALGAATLAADGWMALLSAS